MENTKIQIDSLVPFSLHTTTEDIQIYDVECLKQIKGIMEEQNSISPIAVRPIADGKYEILCGHNIVNAMKTLGYNTINVVVKTGLSDDEAKELYYDSDLNQQIFANWNYSQKIEAVKYVEKLIKENSRQGKRTDLDEKKFENIQNPTYAQSVQKLDNQEVTSVQSKQKSENQETTSVQNRHKSKSNIDQTTTRSKMAKRLGISTSTLSKYRSIIKLPDDILKTIAQFLDQKKITFEVAYRVSQLAEYNVKWFIECVNEDPDRKIDMDKLKALRSKKVTSGEYVVPRRSKEYVKEIFIPQESMVIKRR